MGDGQRIGRHHQVAAGLQGKRHKGRGGPDVEKNRSAIGHKVQNRSGNGALGFGVQAHALGKAGLGAHRAQARSAMKPGDPALGFQTFQPTAHGFFGNGQSAGQSRNPSPLVAVIPAGLRRAGLRAFPENQSLIYGFQRVYNIIPQILTADLTGPPSMLHPAQRIGGAGMTPLERVRTLAIWQGAVQIAPLGGGITNINFVVQDAVRKTVVRIGDDIPVHQILRFNELAASLAAHEAGVSPAVVHHEPGVLVIEFIEGKTLTAEDFQQDWVLDQAISLIRRTHSEIPRHLRGPALTFWVFHVIRDYAATLLEGDSRHKGLLPALLSEADDLERAVGPIEMVFGHNDLLAANFLNDGSRLWLIDWDYAGFGSALFDLGGLAANNGLSLVQETHMLQAYFGSTPDAALWRRYRAMKAAAALRETLWSMVSEIHSKLDFDYSAYTAANLATYRAALAALKD